MTITSPVYATREMVQRATDTKNSARNTAEIDRALESASRSVEGLLHRKFYPFTGTRYFDWPNLDSDRGWKLWLNQNELVSVSSLSSGGTVISAPNYFLEPANEGPPYNRIEINQATTSAFSSGNTAQRNIAVTGVFGYDLTTAVAGQCAEALDTTETGIDVTDSSLIGVGDLILIDTERMLVTDKSMLTSGQTLQTPIGANNSEVTLAVTTGSSFHVDEIILLDAERMLIVDISGNSLIVKRAWDGSVLASHTGSTIYALRTLEVVRGYLGTTAASHLTSAPITKHLVPSLVRQLTIAEAINDLAQQSSAYARVVGSGENQREATGAGLSDLRDRTYDKYARKVRMRSV